MGEDKSVQSFFANVCHRGAVGHATSVSGALVAHLGSWMNHSTQCRDSNGRFESLGI